VQAVAFFERLIVRGVHRAALLRFVSRTFRPRDRGVRQDDGVGAAASRGLQLLERGHSGCSSPIWMIESHAHRLLTGGTLGPSARPVVRSKPNSGRGEARL
jgi:hypothetical protein